MDIEIRALTPDLLGDYLHFFDTDAHADNPDEDRCYCVCWGSVDHRAITDFASPEERRELAVQYVNSGIIQGYLAYCNGQLVGWCNANDKADCLHCISWLRFMTPVNEITSDPNDRVKSIYCFAISPHMKRKGIARRLLQYACQDAANCGYDYVEAYPEKAPADQFHDFMGPLDLYKSCGFAVQGETDRKFVMRKQLKP